MKILVTGGAGYIGSITNALLHSQGHKTVVFDNLSNGHKEAVGKSKLIIGDLTDKDDVFRAFDGDSFDAVIHFAAYTLPGESMLSPHKYFHNNIIGGLNLLEAMRTHGCRNIVFSSTCSVYGYPKDLPVAETSSIAPVSVYGASKRMFEEILDWYGKIYGIRNVKLRYFNAAGAALDGSLGEDHSPETHIIPVALSVASGKKKQFELYGDDYETPDGTCIRDYIHVLDLADAHIKALDYMIKHDASDTFNLGVGRGYSNRQVLDEVKKITKKELNVVVAKRRPGDPDAIFADNTKARKVLGWNPKYSDLHIIIKSAWKWHVKHPEGYGS
ncbi:UDP-glucose 4-epimerase GalE [Patescibacteria group bacterium]|nr:UDP-glucose 4-epimerase GalE [Patescibacteria group bacterium]MBU1473182.1 UDP-glucose 4-epimerase GalE [Patescibacteria group bacterium]MBU2459768.1 UDP-glucose 4-epimerase GalE [Patescibacteria group bacterium]MBU2544280.1 UDP-glucose 4-epimerase GalE [Patescibacteria group bacterium]